MVTDRSGNVPGTEGHGFGLYLHDCRFLSTLQLDVAGVVLAPIRISFASAFEDIFEVRGLIHIRGGEHHPPLIARDRVRLTYEGRDGFVRSTWLQFQPAPARIDETGAEWDLQLARGATF